jgi:hypothetical protein
MLPRRAYLLEVGGDPSPFFGSEMPSPPPKFADIEVTQYATLKRLGH